MKRVTLISILFCCFFINTGNSQNTKKLSVGMNLGAYLPSKAYAVFLNGQHPNGVNRVLTDQIIRPQLEELFGYPIIDWTFPGNMRYDVNIFGGGYLGLRLDEDVSFIMNFNLLNANVNQPLIISLDNPQNIGGQTEQAIISAREQRFDVALGIENEFNQIGPLEFYGAGGGMVNYIRLDRHELVVRNTRRYSIMRLQLVGARNKVYDGFGYGAFGQIGARYYFNEKFSFDLGVEANVIRNKAYVSDLVENTGYSSTLAEDAAKFKLNGNIYFRIIWN